MRDDLGTPSNRERSISVLRRALELGVNHIDTAALARLEALHRGQAG
jgi:diketogulonate reductase-like aldo/keto reductase